MPVIKSGGNKQILGTELWNTDATLGGNAAMRGSWFASVSDGLYGQLAAKYRTRYGKAPYRLASLGYDSVLLTVRIARDWKPGTIFPASRLLAEARRVLRPGGRLVIGFIDRASPLGRDYLARSAESTFYRDAKFHSAEEVGVLLESAGFTIEAWAQTLICAEPAVIEPVRPGYGEGSFVVVAARA